jgi:alanine racemase
MIKIEDMVEVTLDQKDDFLKVRETLTRIGVASKKEKVLYQSCHILHKQGKYYITHFKELFALDGKPTDITENDIARRNTVANLLEDWELIKIVTKEQTKEPTVSLSQVKIISHKEKADWELVPKYNIGKKPQAADK